MLGGDSSRGVLVVIIDDVCSLLKLAMMREELGIHVMLYLAAHAMMPVGFVGALEFFDYLKDVWLPSFHILR
jgi:hypothetical protein